MDPTADLISRQRRSRSTRCRTASSMKAPLSPAGELIELSEERIVQMDVDPTHGPHYGT